LQAMLVKTAALSSLSAKLCLSKGQPSYSGKNDITNNQWANSTK